VTLAKRGKGNKPKVTDEGQERTSAERRAWPRPACAWRITSHAAAVTGKERYAEDASRKRQQETGRGNQPPDERQRRYCDPVDVGL